MKSDSVKKGLDRAPQRSLFNALGFTEEDMQKPLVGIVSSYNEIVPGHMNIDKIVEEIGLEEWHKKYYKDYNSITASILKKISIEIPEPVKNFLDVPEGRTELFKEEDLFNLVEKLASLDLKILEENIRKANKCELINLINVVENRDFSAGQEIAKVEELSYDNELER